MAAGGETGSNEIRKIAYCSAIFAGFAYVGYTTLKSAFCRRVFPNSPEKEHKLFGDKSNRSCQTDLTLPCGVNINKFAEDLVVTPCKSVKDRVRELNIRARQFSDSSPSYTPTSQLSCKSLQNSPWSSPRILSPIDSDNGLSKSAENLNSFTTPPNSPNLRRKSLLKSPPDTISSRVSSTTSLNSISIDFPQPREPDEALKKSLASLYKKARTMTPIESRNLVSLLGSKNDDIVVRTLTTISNCAAFSVNQDLLCDAGCLPVLRDFLDSPTLAIQVSSTQAIANLSANERNQGLLQCCICRLTERATSKQCSELLRVSSLTALANLALFNANHMPMKGGITGFLQLLESGSNTTRLQSLKLLVNLSCNSSMLPYLLASKASSQLYKYLSLKGDHDVSLRLITFIANVVITAARQNFKARDLPGDQKAPYPETLYATIFGHNGKELLRKKMANLVQSTDEDIVLQVKRIQVAMNFK